MFPEHKTFFKKNIFAFLKPPQGGFKNYYKYKKY
jgi:hypothetical protein